ncbi:MAG: hypothetical protein JO111_10025 [Caulobacteraceae bacterium]|nr:hypothetical protein [Caulobacteraceae bacterium]
MVRRATAAVSGFHDRALIAALARRRPASATLLSWLVVFAASALAAAWFGGAWTPPDQAVPGDLWFR